MKGRYSNLLKKSKNPLGTCIKVILIWIAVSDDNFDAAEKDFVMSLFSEDSGTDSAQYLLEILKADESNVLTVSCDFIRRNLESDVKRIFLEMAISIAVIDGPLFISKNHILRFLSDLLGLSSEEFRSIYSEMTGYVFPEPGNPSSIAWWEEKRARSSRQKRKKKAASGQLSYVEALGVLGVLQGASQEEVKEAYRRLVKIHHPDRFAYLGNDAVTAASAVFARINEAYEVALS